MSTHIPPHEAPCKPWGFRTLAVHAGQSPDTSTGAIAPPIVATSAFAYDDFEAALTPRRPLRSNYQNNSCSRLPIKR